MEAFGRFRWLVVLGVILAALGLRLFQLGAIPVGLYWDEQAMLVDARAVATTGHDMHNRVWYQVLYPSYGDYKLPVYIWLASVSVKLLGASELAVRLPSALAGCLSVMLIGWLSFRLTKEPKTGVLAMMVMAVTPWSLLFSRTAFEGHLAQALVLLSVVLLVEANHHRRWQWLFTLGAVLVGGLATYTYFSVRFVWPVVWLGYQGLVATTWPKKVSRKALRSFGQQVGLWWILPVVLFAALLLPMMKSPLYADSNRFRLGTDSVLKNDAQVMQSNVYREWAGNTKIDRLVFHRQWLTLQRLLENYGDNLSPTFLFVTGDPNLRHGTGEDGLFILVMLPFFLWGWWALWQRWPRVALWLVGWWLVALLPASVPENTPHALRSLNALAPLVFVMGLGLTRAVNLGERWVRKWLPLLVPALLPLAVVAVGFVHLPFIYHYFTYYPVDSANSWQGGFKQIATSIFELRQADEPVYIVSFDDRFYLWLLMAGPYQPQEWQSWPTHGYQFSSLPGITWQGIPSNPGARYVVAGRANQVRAALDEHAATIVTQRMIESGTETYLVAKVESSK